MELFANAKRNRPSARKFAIWWIRREVCKWWKKTEWTPSLGLLGRVVECWNTWRNYIDAFSSTLPPSSLVLFSLEKRTATSTCPINLALGISTRNIKLLRLGIDDGQFLGNTRSLLKRITSYWDTRRPSTPLYVCLFELENLFVSEVEFRSTYVDVRVRETKTILVEKKL